MWQFGTFILYHCKMDCISHIKFSNEWIIQTNDVHSSGVAEYAYRFASIFGMEEYGRVMGLIHDKGKERKGFQQHIMLASGYAPDTIIDSPSEHAYVGGLIAQELFPREHSLFSNAVMGHHRGLYDDDEWKNKLEEAIPVEVSVSPISADLNLPDSLKEVKQRDIHHLERMLFSCLVDADFLDTESFMSPEQGSLRGRGDSLSVLLDRLEKYLDQLKQASMPSEVNDIRNYVQTCCRDSGNSGAGYYSLTVPTGGGKTLSSILWALRHAVFNKKERIIVAIPYTSIIAQTAAVLKRIFGDQNVLEHHSDVDYVDPTSELTKSLQLATENWDYPIVVTTNVQFFESIFSNKPSRCRKLHNIANSVIILDEAQVLPNEFLHPIVDALETYHRIFRCSILFTTASQPTLSGSIRGTNPLASFEALPDIKEIIPKEAELHKKLRRTWISFDDNASSYDEIATRVAEAERVLCIVNSRKDAKEIFERLPDEGVRIHLSRMMCPAHVKKSIRLLKEALKDSKKTIIRVVSTQLIEAGVDIDFPVVYRQEAGLDSVLQAAGRCNREGRLPLCPVYVFSLTKEHPLPPGYITQTNNARKNMGLEHDWFSQEAMDIYFKQLYSRVDSFDRAQIGDLLNNPASIMFETAATAFQLIDDNSVPVIVNWEGGMDLVQEWISSGPSASLRRAISNYVVNVRQKDFDRLFATGGVQQLDEQLYYIKDSSFYREDVGLVVDGKWTEEIKFI